MRFRIGSTAVHIHPLLLLLLPLTLVFHPLQTLYPALAAFLIHESGHLLMAGLFHIPVREIEFGIFGGVMDCDMQHTGRMHQVLVSISGPLFSLLGYLISYAILSYSQAHVPFWLDTLRMNLLLFLINSLPILPLDGGQAVLSLFHHSSLCRRILACGGLTAGLFLITLSILSALRCHLNLSLALAGCFLIYTASKDQRSAAGQCMHQFIYLNHQLRKHKPIPLRHFLVCEDMSLLHLIPLLPHHCAVCLHLVSADSSIIGKLSQEQLCHALLHDPTQSLSDVFRSTSALHPSTVAKKNYL